MARFFRFPWALTGDRSDIPEEKQADGSVSYQEGYGPSYELDPAVSPSAKNIERRIYNQLIHDITSTLSQYYQHGVPPFITSEMNGGLAFSYSRYARVVHDGRVYESLVENNTSLPTVAGNWRVIDAGAESDIPPGIISGFAGTEAQIPEKWQLCNGSGTTSNGIQIPDLRNRMIIGSGQSYASGAVGGATSATTNATGNHNHVISVANTTLTASTMPGHRHLSFNNDNLHHATLTMENFPCRAGGIGNQPANNYSEYTIGGSTNDCMAGMTNHVGSSGAHNHGGSSNTTGNHSHTVSTMPPYYALAFIIKL